MNSSICSIPGTQSHDRSPATRFGQLLLASVLLLGMILPTNAFHSQNPKLVSRQTLLKERKTKSAFLNFPLQAKRDEDPLTTKEEGEEKDLYVFDNMVFLGKINQAITTTAYAFIGIGILLNVLGYDFIVRDGQLTIDTLEKRQFENEVKRVMKTSDARTTMAVPDAENSLPK